MRKKTIVALIATWGFFLMGIAGAVIAFYSIQAISSHNVFSTAQLGLLFSDDNQSQLGTVTDSWTGLNLLPGSQAPQKIIEVFNSGSIDADHIDLVIAYTGSDIIAKNFIFGDFNNGFRYGGSGDGSSVNLTSALLGVADTDYLVTQGSNGLPILPTTVDGNDGTIPDGKISLSEVSRFGKIRIKRGEERGGIAAGTAADLTLNAQISPSFVLQSGSVDITITATLEQDPSQF